MWMNVPLTLTTVNTTVSTTMDLTHATVCLDTDSTVMDDGVMVSLYTNERAVIYFLIVIAHSVLNLQSTQTSMSALLELTTVTASVPIPLAATPVDVHLAIDSKVMELLVEVSTQSHA